MRWRRAAGDALVVTAAIVLGWLALRDAPVGDERDADPWAYVLLLVHCASVLPRRRWPWVALLAGFGTALAYAGARYPTGLPPVTLLSVYSAGALLPPRAGRLALAVSVVLGWLVTSTSPGPTNASVPALVVAAWLLGNRVERRNAHTVELEAANRELRAAQLELATRAVSEERLRIARELHDVVAHTMSVVAVHAGTGRMVADRDPEAARAALATIETSTRSALSEMRRLLGVLRGAAGDAEPTALAPAPGLRDVDALVAGIVRSGVTVDVRVIGARGEVPPGVDLAAYRIVQEALTNVLKHAGAVRATVTITYRDADVLLEVENEPGAPRAVDPHGGHGLEGMRERVALYGGDLGIGPRPDGGWRVAARLPRREDGA